MAKKKLTPFEKNKAEYNEFVKSLDGKTKDELLAIEQDLIKTIDKHDRKVAKYEFKVTDAEALAEAVDIAHEFMDKMKLPFNQTIGMLQLYDAFKKDLQAIPYPVFDLLLTTLGQLEFQGHDEWVKINKFNAFTEPYSEEYAELKAKTFRLAEEHSTLQSKLGLTNPDPASTK